MTATHGCHPVPRHKKKHQPPIQIPACSQSPDVCKTKPEKRKKKRTKIRRSCNRGGSGSGEEKNKRTSEFPGHKRRLRPAAPRLPVALVGFSGSFPRVPRPWPGAHLVGRLPCLNVRSSLWDPYRPSRRTWACAETPLERSRLSSWTWGLCTNPG